ncbi:hypothetical protein HCQ94_03235 [Actinomyces sp. zg-332]|uniref:SMODS-associated NUDIX domain-containing protein n=1 Tax=Actinomyces sp. zg-332 TaxID=2708340 RepID=UPI0018E06867|nr:hypothetical protein HCQ94_03235 [Actinomyces sp. zg-332]
MIGIFAANYKRIGLFVKSLIHWSEDIRFSIAYLYKIKIDDKYLLYKVSKIERTYYFRRSYRKSIYGKLSPSLS